MCGKIKFHSKAPMLKFCQESFNSCCFSILASSFDSIIQTKTANYILMCTEESLKSEVVNSIDIANSILKNENKIKGEQKVYYILRKYKNMGSFLF